MASLKEHSGMSRTESMNDSTSQVARLEREFKQLRSTTRHVHDPLGQSSSAIGRGRDEIPQQISVQELVEREIKAYGAAQQADRGRMERSIQHRSQSVDRGQPEWYAPEQRRPFGMLRMNELHKQLAEMDAALQQARQENIRLREEKDACVAAHERDVAALESMLSSVMAENENLKGKTFPKHAGRAELEKNIKATLIQSGISHIPSTPNSDADGSSSTQTPPPSNFEPEAEEVSLDERSLDISRASIDVISTSPILR